MKRLKRSEEFKVRRWIEVHWPQIVVDRHFRAMARDLIYQETKVDATWYSIRAIAEDDGREWPAPSHGKGLSNMIASDFLAEVQSIMDESLNHPQRVWAKYIQKMFDLFKNNEQ